jgi:hypothetical protein
VNVNPWIIPQRDTFLMGNQVAHLRFIPPGDKFRMGSSAAQLSFIMSDTDRVFNRFESVNRGEPSGGGFRKFALNQDDVKNPYARKGNRIFGKGYGFQEPSIF